MAELEICRDPQELYAKAASLFTQRAKEAVSTQGRFCVALSGGSTPEGIYRLLAGEPFRSQVPWSEVHVFWGDERCVGPMDPASNYRLAERSLISSVPIPSQNVHRIAGELLPEEAARTYAQTLREIFSPRGGMPRFDLILLGMGVDGHTASLFPASSALGETDRWVAAHFVQNVNAWRITLTLPVLNQAAHVMFLVSGRDKAAMVRRVIEDRSDSPPAGLVRPAEGRLLWLVDREAAGQLGSTDTSP